MRYAGNASIRNRQLVSESNLIFDAAAPNRWAEALATLFATTANCLGIGEGMPHYVNRFVPNVDQARAC